MAQKLTFVCVAFFVFALNGESAKALDLIELNDANANAIGLVDVSKALGGVQNAYNNMFRFESTYALRKFITQCQLLKAHMSDAQDSDFGGLAKQIKSIIAEQSIEQACSVTNEQLTGDFDELDDLSKGDTIYPPLSSNVLNLLVSLTERVKADPALSQVAGYLVKSKVEEVGTKLMSSAPNDIEMMIGEIKPVRHFFDLETRYQKFCKISLIAPICRLVRKTSHDVSAIASDVKKFSALLKSGAAHEVSQHVEISGVSVGDTQAQCERLQRDLKPIAQIHKYLEAGLISEVTLEANMEIDPSLDSYMALYELCQVAVSSSL